MIWPGQAGEPIRRIALTLDGVTFDRWTRAEIIRDLSEISGSFQLELQDGWRDLSALPWATRMIEGKPINWGAAALLSIDGEPVLKGWVDDVITDASEGRFSLAVAGRDLTGDLVDCHHDPKGRHEWRDVKLEEFAAALCKPFGISVTAEVDTGAPIKRAVIETGEKVMSAIEKYARQRALLVLSDGVGGLLLTRSGTRRAPGAPHFPGLAFRQGARLSMRERFSDYFIKAQAEKNGGRRGARPGLSANDAPRAAQAPAPEPVDGQPSEGGGALVMGHARDEEITRWRPFVAAARTQANGVDAQTQAEWHKRTRRGKGETLNHMVEDYRSGGRLWRPNELADVSDRWARIARDMLVAGVTYSYGAEGVRTRLKLTGPEAYDLLPEGERRSSRGEESEGGLTHEAGLDSEARPLE
jgi:prophage tail gpP-like protein